MTLLFSNCFSNSPVFVCCSSEPTVPGDEEEAAASPEPEPEVEEKTEAAVVELKSETMLETQTDTNTADDQTEKSPAAAPPTAEPAAVPAEPAPTAPEDNRVRLNLHSWKETVAAEEENTGSYKQR